MSVLKFERKIDNKNFEFTLRGETNTFSELMKKYHPSCVFVNFIYKVIYGENDEFNYDEDIAFDIPTLQFNQFIDDYISNFEEISHDDIFESVLKCIHISKDLTMEFLKHIRIKYNINDQQMGDYCRIIMENVCGRRQLIQLIVNYIISLDCNFKFYGTGCELCNTLTVFFEDYIRQKQKERRECEK